MSNKKPVIKFALPVGSLNNPERGNTSQLLADAGFEVEGYEPKKEAMKPRFVNDPEIDAFADRPQNMPPAMYRGAYDLTICGSDWMWEWELAKINRGRNKICELGYGNVDVVVAVRKGSRIRSLERLIETRRIAPSSTRLTTNPRNLFRNPIRIRTEYLNITREAVQEASQDGMDAQSVVIEQSYGRTEVGMMNDSSVDAIVEATQTGTSLRNAGLKVIAKLFSSTTCLYASPEAMSNRQKRKKIEDIASLLEGVVRGRSFEYVTFNVQESNLPGVVNYLKEKGYAAKEPTVSVYAGNAVVSTLLPKNGYPSIVPELLRLGADDIVRLNTSQIVSRR